jgi:hypothetical protein
MMMIIIQNMYYRNVVLILLSQESNQGRILNKDFNETLYFPLKRISRLASQERLVHEISCCSKLWHLYTEFFFKEE